MIRTCVAAVLLGAASAVAATDGPTFHRDIEPILQARCQGCHRPSQAAPMSFLSYEEVQPWAKAIKDAVLLKRMPPWPADPAFGKFSNDQRLSERELQTLTRWADQGAPAGNKADAPPPVKFEERWQIGKPDLVLRVPKEFVIPASGQVDYQYIMMETGFAEDKWVKTAEIRPRNRQVLHHAWANARPARPADAARLGQFFQVDVDLLRPRDPNDPNKIVQFSASFDSEAIANFTPGGIPLRAEQGRARLIKAGSILSFQLHYTPTGKETTDQIEIGFVFADEPPAERVKTVNVQNFDFSIPPGVPDHAVKARAVVKQDLKIAAMRPHMHLRGKSFEYRVLYPGGKSETLLKVPRWDFNWQLTYYLEEPKVIPRGSIIEVAGIYDNSPNNPHNPDPQAQVSYGEQIWDEMLGGLIDVVVAPGLESAEIFGTVVEATGTSGGA